MKTNKLFLSALTIFSLSAAACGGDDDGNGGGGSGVEASKALTELTAAERQDVCDYGDSLFSKTDSKKFGCFFSAIFATENEAECQTAYEACLAGPDDAESGFSCPVEEEPPACAAEITVGEMEACARDQAKQVSSALSTLSCASDGSELSSLSEVPPSCKPIVAKCPELF